MADSNQRRQYREVLRAHLRDKPELNRITKAIEFEDEQLDQALDFGGVMDWNMTPPILGEVTLETHPAPSLLVRGATIWACNSDAVREARNPHQFSDGGTVVSEQSKPGLYNVVLGPIRAKYEQMKTTYKANQNINAGWGGAPSDLSYI